VSRATRRPTRSAASTPAWEVLSDLGASYLVEMSLSDWIALPEHPRRRDTERQSKKEHWAAVRVAKGPVFESLRWVVAADLNGDVCKVNGHTRSLLWERGQLRPPSSVIAQVYRCSSRDELNAIYATFDTQLAAETLYDRVTGAYREWGLTLTSQRLRAGTIVDALSIACRGVARPTERSGREEEFDIYAAVGSFANELQKLDSLNPQTEHCPTGIVAAALLSLAEDPGTLEYFRRLVSREGSKRAGLPDPVEAILEQLQKLKQRKSARVRSEQEDLCARTLAAVRAWRAGASAPSYWGEAPLQTFLLTDAVHRVRAQTSAAALSHE
jgi:hypothetical protein